MIANPLEMMLRRYLIENVEHSGRKKVDDVERRCVRVGQNIDKIYLLVCSSPLSPEIIVTSSEIFLMEFTTSLILL